MNKLSTNPAQGHNDYRKALHYALRDKLPLRPNRNYERAAYTTRHKSTQFKNEQNPHNQADSTNKRKVSVIGLTPPGSPRLQREKRRIEGRVMFTARSGDDGSSEKRRTDRHHEDV